MKEFCNKNLLDLEKNLGYKFNNYKVLRKALIHTSYANENDLPHYESNQRLEFLGDAVLDLIISEILYKKYSKTPEGQLTKNRAKTVCEANLAEKASNINLGEFIYLGKGESKSGGKNRSSILADAFEALIGAIYIDGGLEKTIEFIKRNFQEIFMIENFNESTDYKTLLQEIIQKDYNNIIIIYKIIDESGPDHEKEFSVNAIIEGEIVGFGKGKSKKEAEQIAAKMALKKYK